MLQRIFEQRVEKVRIETERHNAKTSQDATIRLFDDRHRHRYATRLATVAYFDVANALISDKVLNV